MNQKLQERRFFMTTLGAVVSTLLGGRPAAARENVASCLVRIDSERLRHSRPLRSPKVRSAEIDGRFVLFKKGQADPIGALNPTARTLWENCDGRHSLDDISRHICRTYQVSPHQAYADCIVFLTKLSAKKAIVF